MSLLTVRRFVFEQLEPSARKEAGLSLANRLLVIAIIASVTTAIIDTEPAVASAGAVLQGVDMAFAGLFLVEYVARIWIAPEHPRLQSAKFPRLRYIFTPAALIDLAAILPTLLAFGGGGALALRSFRVLRMLRLAKLGRMSTAWVYISEAVRSRRYELTLTVAFAILTMIVTGTLLYWAEGGTQPKVFGSIPRAMWWSVITLTTVGYGDVYPVTALGKMLASVTAVVGIGLIALPTGILAAAFSDAVQRHRRTPVAGLDGQDAKTGEA